MIKSPNLPTSFNVLINELKGLALNVELIGVKKEEDDEDDARDYGLSQN
jgi:DNA-directed RNA polymerase beta subunit